MGAYEGLYTWIKREHVLAMETCVREEIKTNNK
mgnify:CR=1 FL=1